MKRLTLVMMLLVLVPALATAAQATAGDSPRPVMEVAEKIVDLGDLSVNSKQDGVFIVRNTGKAPLEIREVRPTCGCTVADYDRTVPPGGAGRITATLDTTGFLGPISKAIMVFTNDPEVPQVNLVLKANVRTYVDVLPRPLLRFNVLQGEPASDKVVLVAESDAEFRLLGVEGTGAGIEVAARELKGDERIPERGGSQWELTVTIPADAPEGMLNRRLLVRTSSAKAPEVQVTISGVVRPIVQIIPGEVNFGQVSSQHPIGRNLVLISNRQGHEMKIAKAEVDNAAFSVETTQMGGGQRFQVAVTLKPGTPSGTHRGILKVSTNDPARPLIEVPVQAVVR